MVACACLLVMISSILYTHEAIALRDNNIIFILYQNVVYVVLFRAFSTWESLGMVMVVFLFFSCGAEKLRRFSRHRTDVPVRKNLSLKGCEWCTLGYYFGGCFETCSYPTKKNICVRYTHICQTYRPTLGRIIYRDAIEHRWCYMRREACRTPPLHRPAPYYILIHVDAM